MDKLNYIGVSGVGSQEQQRQSTEAFQSSGLRDLGRALLLGVKATTRIQVDEIEARRGSDWFPVGDSLRHVLGQSDETVNVLQLYADDWTDLNNRAIPLMERSIERAEGWADGLQYDMLPWFEQNSGLQIVERYANAVSGPVILQCYGDIMRNHSPAMVIERLKRVQGFVSHVLFDASEGRGRLMDSDTLSIWVEALCSSELDMAPVIAGGLDGESARVLLLAIVRRFGNISWDAEGALHTGNVLDRERVAEYLQASAEVLQG